MQRFLINVSLNKYTSNEQEMYLPMDFNNHKLVGVKQKQKNDFHTKILAPCRLEEVLWGFQHMHSKFIYTVVPLPGNSTSI
jgi:hypothetical protein